MATPTQEFKFVTVNGKRLETLLYSPARANATIVMLHEGLGSIAMRSGVFALRPWKIGAPRGETLR